MRMKPRFLNTPIRPFFFGLHKTYTADAIPAMPIVSLQRPFAALPILHSRKNGTNFVSSPLTSQPRQ
ncbi:MAG: hypothetical protein NZ534_11680, partial [Bacteroidia bacterium]|nr:hypothetical protein [Bacteroidia bacterium]